MSEEQRRIKNQLDSAVNRYKAEKEILDDRASRFGGSVSVPVKLGAEDHPAWTEVAKEMRKKRIKSYRTRESA